MTVRRGVAAGIVLAVVLGACSDDGEEPVLERIDGPAQVDEERLQQQTPEDGTVRGG